MANKIETNSKNFKPRINVKDNIYIDLELAVKSHSTIAVWHDSCCFVSSLTPQSKIRIIIGLTYLTHTGKRFGPARAIIAVNLWHSFHVICPENDS